MRPTEMLVAFAMLVLCVSCSSRPDGPPFRPMTPPGENEALLYVYRQDALRGVGPADIQLDGDKLGQLKNGEYLALLVKPGGHELAVRLKWLGFLPRSWNRASFRSGPGQTLYLRVWADYKELAQVRGAPEAPGRADRGAEVAIFVGGQTAAEGASEIERTKRVKRP